MQGRWQLAFTGLVSLCFTRVACQACGTDTIVQLKSSPQWAVQSSLDFGTHVTGMKVSKSRHNYTAKHWLEMLQNSAQWLLSRHNCIAIFSTYFFAVAEKCARKTYTLQTHTMTTVCLRGSAWPPRHNNNMEILIGTKCAKNALIHLIVTVKVMYIIIWRHCFILDCDFILVMITDTVAGYLVIIPLTHTT